MHFAKTGSPAREFSIRSKAPQLDVNAPGLHLVLTRDRLGSVQVGAPILYRQIRVGSVRRGRKVHGHPHRVYGGKCRCFVREDAGLAPIRPDTNSPLN
ncbi:hypothetical protein EMIT0324P_100143 [Pseudomonas chlororaphis]